MLSFSFPRNPNLRKRESFQENENQKKSGWFPLKPKNTTPQKHVSRPPSTSTFANVKNPHLPTNGSPGKGAPTVPPVDEEDDLPPRMDSAHASPRVAPVPLPGSGKSAPTLSRPSTPSNDPSSHIPIHAGFDLNAIKNALQEVEQKVSHAPSSSTSPPPPKSFTQLSPPPIAPSSNRSQSTPPVQVVGVDAHPRASSFDYGYGAPQSPSEDKLPSGIGLGYDHPSRDSATFAGPSHPYS